MPALTNQRHEAFANHIATRAKTRISQAEAYMRSGYKAQRKGAEALGCRLLKNIKVQRRIAEISAPAVRKSRITMEKVLMDAEAARLLAMDTKQPSAAIAATQLTAKLVGLLVDRKEAGQPGDFAGLTSRDEVIAAIRDELGDDAAALLHALAAPKGELPPRWPE
jgi:hypothetical protein